jgi:hypothetical protein
MPIQDCMAKAWLCIAQTVICNYYYYYFIMALQPFVGRWPPFQFLVLYTVGRTPWIGDQLV